MLGARFLTRGAVDLVQRAARNSVGSLASTGFENEGLYLAVKTLAEGWHKPAADGLVSGFREVLSQSGNMADWQMIIASQQTKDPADDLVSQIVLQSPKYSEAIKRSVTLNSGRGDMGQQMISAGVKLVDLGLYDAGLSLLSSATYDKLAGVAAIPFLNDAIAHVPGQGIVKISDSDARSIRRDLATAAVRLADTNHYVSALHANLLEPLIVGDLDHFTDIGKLVIGQSHSGSVGSKIDPLWLVLELSKKGYRGQAIDLLTSATGVPYDDHSGWRQMYDIINPRRSRGAGRFANSIAPSLVKRAGVDLAPPTPAVTSAVPDAVPTESSSEAESSAAAAESTPNEAGPGAREVNCSIEEKADYPPNRFDLRVNIGPKEDGSMAGRFMEPDWADREFIDLRIVVSGPEVVVRPAWQSVRLPRIGKTDDVRFQVTAGDTGALALWVRVYAEETNTLLDEHLLRIARRINEGGANDG